ncbi:hypothetical protein [Caulobacter phage Cr30]|uniref:hypothetical protein n=1 Tax=Caulobacter phage Cr30 TaxID=1357714 RepID=UPI0004A9B484|nr:hypothetical protein OZ74_gp046 [Caulobacter phage Cr30]AGS80931.1 hypothetical protein [Caulobacter phage Cr30]
MNLYYYCPEFGSNLKLENANSNLSKSLFDYHSERLKNAYKAFSLLSEISYQWNQPKSANVKNFIENVIHSSEKIVNSVDWC